MPGLETIITGADFGATGWATGPALARQNFVGSATQAFVFDPSVMSSLWQDRERTVPVTALGQPVLGISDRSGKGLHAALTTGASGTPTWQGSGGLFWIDIPLNGTFEVSNPMAATDSFSAIIAARITGGSSATERALMNQRGTSTESFLALQVGQRSGVQGMNLASTGGWELTGNTVANGTDYCLGFVRDMGTNSAALRMNGTQTHATAGAWTIPSVSSQPTTVLFGSSASDAITQTVSGRLYYAAFAKGARDNATFSALEAIAKAKAGIA